MSGRLQGKTAVVTGAASGIGYAIASRFAQEGARVLAADVDSMDELVAAHDDSIAAHHTDVTDSEQVSDLIAATERRFGRLDIMCNNAGIVRGVGVKLADMEEAVFEKVMRVNAHGTFLGMKHAIPLMLAGGGGAVVNIASTCAFVAQSGSSPYYASKAAVVMLTKTAAIDYAEEGIRVNAICPGHVDTPMTSSVPDELRDRVRGLQPMNRSGRPEEIAATAVFLASDEASFTTGAAYVVDGGRTARG